PELLAGRLTGWGPVAFSHRDVFANGQPLRTEDQLHVLLVHADRAGEHARADVRDAGHLEQALDRPVLAVWPVRDGQHDVDATEAMREMAGRAGHYGGVALVGPRHDMRVWLGH